MRRTSEVCQSLNEHIGKTIRRRRRLLGLTQEALADRLGFSFQGVQKWECGVCNISAAQLVLVAEALETAPANLLPLPTLTKDRPPCPPFPK